MIRPMITLAVLVSWSSAFVIIRRAVMHRPQPRHERNFYA